MIEEYLGDGVYASFDGYHVWLDLRAQDPGARIALEPAVFGALIEFQERAWAEVEAAKAEEATEEGTGDSAAPEG